MRYWILLILQTTTLALFAQEEPKKNRIFYLGGYYSADYTRGTFDGGFGYSSGINIKGETSPKFRIDIGLHFSSIGVRKENLTLGSSLNPTTGTFDTTYTLKQKYQFLEIPIKINYFLTKAERINTFLIAGILSNYLLKTRTTYKTNPSNGAEKKGDPFPVTYSYDTFGIGGIVGFGIGVNITSRLAINFQPEYRLYFGSNKFSALGLNSGIVYQL